MHFIDEYEKVLCKHVLRHARRIGFIEDHQVFAIELNADVFSEIQTIREEASNSLEKVARQLQDLDIRVNALEQWSSEATEQFRKACENDERMVQDIAISAPVSSNKD